MPTTHQPSPKPPPPEDDEEEEESGDDGGLRCLQVRFRCKFS